MAKLSIIASALVILCTAGLCTPKYVQDQRAHWDARYEQLLRPTPRDAYRVVKRGYHGDGWDLEPVRDVVIDGVPCKKGTPVRLFAGHVARATLSQPHRVEGALYPAGTTLVWHSEGEGKARYLERAIRPAHKRPDGPAPKSGINSR